MVPAQGHVLSGNHRIARNRPAGACSTSARVVTNDFNINIREVNIHSHDGNLRGKRQPYVKGCREPQCRQRTSWVAD